MDGRETASSESKAAIGCRMQPRVDPQGSCPRTRSMAIPAADAAATSSYFHYLVLPLNKPDQITLAYWRSLRARAVDTDPRLSKIMVVNARLIA